MEDDKRALALYKANLMVDAIVALINNIGVVHEKYKLMKKYMEYLPFDDYMVLDFNVRAMLHRSQLLEDIEKDMDLWLTIFELKEKKEAEDEKK